VAVVAEVNPNGPGLRAGTDDRLCFHVRQ
jgi:hypothetical protein